MEIFTNEMTDVWYLPQNNPFGGKGGLKKKRWKIDHDLTTVEAG